MATANASSDYVAPGDFERAASDPACRNVRMFLRGDIAGVDETESGRRRYPDGMGNSASACHEAGKSDRSSLAILGLDL